MSGDSVGIPNPTVLSAIWTRFAEWKQEQTDDAVCGLVDGQFDEEAKIIGADRMRIYGPLREVDVVEDGVVI